LERKFLLFYETKRGYGHVWIYGMEELKKEVKVYDKKEETEDIKILQVIEIFDYKEIDIDDILD